MASSSVSSDIEQKSARDPGFVAAEAETVARAYRQMVAALSKVIVGQEKVLELMLTALFCQGHCILEVSQSFSR